MYPRGKIKEREPIPLKGITRGGAWKEDSGGKLDGFIPVKVGTEQQVFAKFSIDIHTILSVHNPRNKKPLMAIGYKPDWGFLARALRARCLIDDDGPQNDLPWANTAVSEYRAFLQLKIE